MKHILGAAVLSLGIFVVDVVACTCAEGSVTYYRGVAAAVFLGKAVAKRPVTPADPSSQVEVTFEVEKVWKGRVSRTVTVLTGPTGEFGNTESMCAPIFAIGAGYVVFAYGVGTLSTDVCTGTSGFPHARKMLGKLGGWRPPAPGRRPPNNGIQRTRN